MALEQSRKGIECPMKGTKRACSPPRGAIRLAAFSSLLSQRRWEVMAMFQVWPEEIAFLATYSWNVGWGDVWAFWGGIISAPHHLSFFTSLLHWGDGCTKEALMALIDRLVNLSQCALSRRTTRPMVLPVAWMATWRGQRTWSVKKKISSHQMLSALAVMSSYSSAWGAKRIAQASNQSINCFDCVIKLWHKIKQGSTEIRLTGKS